MNAPRASYRKLPGRTVNFFGGRSQLWLAEDHLLEVAGLVMAERYRRFPLADIRAIVVEQTRAQAIGLWIYGGLLLLGGGGAAALGWGGTQVADQIGAGIFYAFAVCAGILAVIALVGLLLTLLRGSSCRCSVQTTAGFSILAAPNRRRGAEQVLAILAPEIEAAQTAPTAPSTPSKPSTASLAR